jgi:uncharacterized protein (TIGR03437 family)
LIGGVPAEVRDAGITVGTPGSYQVNVVVPDGIQPAIDVPVTVTVANQTSPAETMVVR